jgi:hypothetical protein
MRNLETKEMERHLVNFSNSSCSSSRTIDFVDYCGQGIRLNEGLYFTLHTNRYPSGRAGD